MPEALTARTLIGAVIILLVAALLVPTLRGALDQIQQIAADRAHLEVSQAKSDQLDLELTRWEDPVFIEAQARSRIGYVRPGDTVWRPIGGEMLVEDVDPVTGVRVGEGVVGSTAGQTWYEALLESFLVANGPIGPAPDDLNEILSRTKDN
jgi:cell division protein FtsB